VTKQRIGDSEVSFAVFEVNRVDFVGLGRGADLMGEVGVRGGSGGRRRRRRRTLRMKGFKPTKHVETKK
jgi:hypothetical protein